MDFLIVEGSCERVKQLLDRIAEIMIEGHAVTALGHARATFDLDRLIPRSSSGAWRSALTSMSYRPFAESEHFHP
jgi:hypothetical protein